MLYWGIIAGCVLHQVEKPQPKQGGVFVLRRECFAVLWQS